MWSKDLIGTFRLRRKGSRSGRLELSVAERLSSRTRPERCSKPDAEDLQTQNNKADRERPVAKVGVSRGTKDLHAGKCCIP